MFIDVLCALRADGSIRFTLNNKKRSRHARKGALLTVDSKRRNRGHRKGASRDRPHHSGPERRYDEGAWEWIASLFPQAKGNGNANRIDRWALK